MAPILLLGCCQCSFPDEKPIILFRIIQLGVKTADLKILNFFWQKLRNIINKAGRIFTKHPTIKAEILVTLDWVK
jgi:hypothetical protein